MPPTILVCDNEPALRSLVNAALDPDGYRIVEATDGEESMAAARHVQPDLILLDMMMPGRTGLDVLSELRRDPRLSGTVVLILTARTQASDRAAAFAAGADGFVPKPFSPLELAAMVRDRLRRAA